MKFFALILSIYIFGLNLASCDDYDVLNNEVKTEISQTIDAEYQQQDSDLCSPFCQCHCCHVHTTQFKIVEFTITSTTISTEVYYHFKGLVKDFNAIILQPPQV